MSVYYALGFFAGLIGATIKEYGNKVLEVGGNGYSLLGNNNNNISNNINTHKNTLKILT